MVLTTELFVLKPTGLFEDFLKRFVRWIGKMDFLHVSFVLAEFLLKILLLNKSKHMKALFSIILGILVSALLFSCTSTFINATFRNSNVYKTKTNLKVKKVYYDIDEACDNFERTTADQREFTIVPNVIPVVTKTTTNVETTPATSTTPSQTTTTIITTTIPPSVTNTSRVITTPILPATFTTSSSSVTYSIPPTLTTNYFLRYKVILDEGDYKYIRILTGCLFAGTYPMDTSIVFNPGENTPADAPEDYIFQVSKKDLTPNTHYLASTALIGKVITLPLRVRNEYWNNDNKVLQGSLSIGYGFGWKFKFGNNPYKKHYFSVIPYSAGISEQKYFSIIKNNEAGKDSLSAKSDELALTYFSFGLAYEYDRFNVGIFFGKDKMVGTLKNWAYQDKWWWGLGIGYELFK